MTDQAVIGLVAIAVTLLLAGGAWMFRIDRLLTRVDTRLETVTDDHAELRTTVNEHSRSIGDLDRRVTRLEPKGTP